MCDARLLRFISLFAQDESGDGSAREKRESASATSIAPMASPASSSSAATATKTTRLSLSRASSDILSPKSSTRSAAAIAKLADAIGGCLKVVALTV
jgi:hypothetical protein